MKKRSRRGINTDVNKASSTFMVEMIQNLLLLLLLDKQQSRQLRRSVVRLV